MGIITLQLQLLKASDGSVADDLAVNLVSQPMMSRPGYFTSFQIVTPAGVVGTWAVQDTDDAHLGGEPEYNSPGWDDFPTDSYQTAPKQPNNNGVCVTTLLTLNQCAWKRLVWSRSNGGRGVLPVSVRAAVEIYR